ncbi:MAG: SDR family NAD(P)-dependent oxidoreductase [Okeania sp. SIO3H1]|uniref:SDR family NAD(P)-dependent oxidoreductase n=1 Tax=Okeania sp. SIO1I7 TaxID=2607772 RepID=UPI0013C5D89C|nr:SDR family NAD(P)-dependent oxidoreductase [Okeania sp. SIO1I7]NEN90413.1 SDR family NAD(P)-dependent oxidoreductase [Okeania sp. SIO3H1]NET28108.1 SDR family NAD(P)-dependent oxidoreductase [Okeania sp. SIO1I7]
MNTRMAIVTGASGAVGACYVKHFVQQNNTKCVALSRSKLESTKVIQFKVDLLDEKGTREAIEQLDISQVSDLILVHGVGKFKYEDLESLPHLNHDRHKIDDEVFSSNYHTFVNVVNPLVKKLNEEHQRGRKTTLALCGFGSISDRYKIPFWRSYTYAKDTLRKYIKDLAKSEDWKGLIRGRFINVSTTDTGNENKLRPNVTVEEKQYWLKPEKIVAQSMPVIESLKPLWQEIDVYEILPGFNPEEYYNDYQTIKGKWERQMGLTKV